MDLKHLRHFVAIVDHGTFLAAAKRLPLSQPALTRSLQNLEADLGVRLLERSTRGIRITDAGERLYQRAKFILNEAEKAVKDVQNSHPTQKINIGIAPMFAAHYVPDILRQLYSETPDLNVTIKSALFTQLLRNLLSGEIDVVLANLPFAVLPDTLLSKPLLDITIVYVTSASHPLAGKKNCSFADISNFPWAAVDEVHANDLYDYIFTSAGETLSPIKLKTNSLTLLKSVINKGPYITLLPHHMVAQDVKEGRLSILSTDQDKLKRKGGLIYRKNELPNSALERFKAISAEVFN